jgi:hypothetical protein
MDLRALAKKARHALLLIEVYDNGGEAVATGSGEGFYCLLTTICGAERLISPCALNSSKWSARELRMHCRLCLRASVLPMFLRSCEIG